MTNMDADVAAVAYASSALDVSTDTISRTTAAVTSSVVSEIFLQTVAAKAIAGVFALLSIIIACVQVCFIYRHKWRSIVSVFLLPELLFSNTCFRIVVFFAWVAFN